VTLERHVTNIEKNEVNEQKNNLFDLKLDLVPTIPREAATILKY
jgi:hypothetical protein